jgi:hypothetical protein
LNRPKTDTDKQADTHVADGNPLRNVRIPGGVGAMGSVMKGGVAEIDGRS